MAAGIFQRWAADARLSSAVDTPWGTPSSDVADRFDALALATRSLADAAEKKDQDTLKTARASFDEKLQALKPLLARSAEQCFPPGDESVPKGASSFKLPPAKIQETVRSRFGGLRSCYESGLIRNPDLRGRVAVLFAIQRDGKVAWAVDDGSDMPDAQVIDCVVQQVPGLLFPPPDGGILTVVYPIMFSPDPGGQ